LRLDHALELAHIDADLVEQRLDDPLGFAEQGPQQVERRHLRVAALLGQALRTGHGFLGFDRQFVEIKGHLWKVPSSKLLAPGKSSSSARAPPGAWPLFLGTSPVRDVEMWWVTSPRTRRRWRRRRAFAVAFLPAKLRERLPPHRRPGCTTSWRRR